jgi:hypothetical protein
MLSCTNGDRFPLETIILALLQRLAERRSEDGYPFAANQRDLGRMRKFLEGDSAKDDLLWEDSGRPGLRDRQTSMVRRTSRFGIPNGSRSSPEAHRQVLQLCRMPLDTR